MKIISSSHLDHSLHPEHLAWLLERFSDKAAFFLETVELPEHLPSLSCGLHGPAMGDEPVKEAEVHYAVRGDRPWASRLCRRPARQTRLLTVIAGPDEEAAPGEPCVLWTAFGGPCTPKEPWDVHGGQAGYEQSLHFWRAHALTAQDA